MVHLTVVLHSSNNRCVLRVNAGGADGQAHHVLLAAAMIVVFGTLLFAVLVLSVAMVGGGIERGRAGATADDSCESGGPQALQAGPFCVRLRVDIWSERERLLFVYFV